MRRLETSSSVRAAARSGGFGRGLLILCGDMRKIEKFAGRTKSPRALPPARRRDYTRAIEAARLTCLYLDTMRGIAALLRAARRARARAARAQR